MERKIGEIFEYNGEWYQCVEGLYCYDCAFVDDNCEDRERITLREKLTKQPVTGFCNSEKRKDGKDVIFKKLEKVGEPYDFQKRIFQTYKLHTIPFLSEDVELVAIPSKDNNTIEIEIKEDMEEQHSTENYPKEDEVATRIANKVGEDIRDQLEKNLNKEDMKKGQCCDTRFDIIAKAKEALLKETNIARDKQEMAVIDNILFRCWQMGWLDKYDDTKHSNSENSGKNLKPFDLEAAKAGKPVCTRDGRKARIICFDRRDTDNYCIVALIEDKESPNKERVRSYFDNGKYLSNDEESVHDLMMLSEKKEGWVNLYKSATWSTKEEAMKYRNKCNDYIDTIKITFEE